MTYQSTKTFGHDLGISVAFRQHKATHSHCRFIHGYALAIKLTFQAERYPSTGGAALDSCGWVMDFGNMKDVKKWIMDNYDHKLLVAEDDPACSSLAVLSTLGVADVRVLKATGCEAFAKEISDFANFWLRDNGHKPRVKLVSVEVKEHGANSAIYIGE